MAEMTQEEVAALLCERLREAGVTVTLSGGACAGIWAGGAFVSNDIDLIEEGLSRPRVIRRALQELGFRDQGGGAFAHPDSPYFAEFPSGPLMVGQERVRDVVERQPATGRLRLLSPADSVKDRLAAYYHWGDQQSLEQALLVARAQVVDLAEIERWSVAEAQVEKFRVFAGRLDF